jgi:hypothetical protein
VQHLATELKLAQRSSPSPVAMARYQQLFPHVQQSASQASLGEWLQRLVGKLTWDSRQQLAPQGARSANSSNYRLLYVAPKAELELMVSPQAHNRRVDGDIITLSGQAPLTPALIQLQPTLELSTTTSTGLKAELLYEAASDDNGRFHLDAVPTGRYTLLITPLQGVHLTFDLEIT